MDEITAQFLEVFCADQARLAADVEALCARNHALAVRVRELEQNALHEPLMSIQQAADQLGVSYSTIYEEVKRGAIPSIPIGGETQEDGTLRGGKLLLEPADVRDYKARRRALQERLLGVTYDEDAKPALRVVAGKG